MIDVLNKLKRAGDRPEDYLLSSARDYAGGKGLIAIGHLTATFGLRH